MGQLWAYSPARLLWSTSGSWEPWIGNILAGGYWVVDIGYMVETQLEIFWLVERKLYILTESKLYQRSLLWSSHIWRTPTCSESFTSDEEGQICGNIIVTYLEITCSESFTSEISLMEKVKASIIFWSPAGLSGGWLIDWLIDINMMDCLSKTELCSWYQNSPAGLSVDLQKNTFLHFRCVERKAGKVFVLSPWNILMRKAQLCGLFQNYVNWIEFSKGAIKFMG